MLHRLGSSFEFGASGAGRPDAVVEFDGDLFPIRCNERAVCPPMASRGGCTVRNRNSLAARMRSSGWPMDSDSFTGTQASFDDGRQAGIADFLMGHSMDDRFQ